MYVFFFRTFQEDEKVSYFFSKEHMCSADKTKDKKTIKKYIMTLKDYEKQKQVTIKITSSYAESLRVTIRDTTVTINGKSIKIPTKHHCKTKSLVIKAFREIKSLTWELHSDANSDKYNIVLITKNGRYRKEKESLEEAIFQCLKMAYESYKKIGSISPVKALSQVHTRFFIT